MGKIVISGRRTSRSTEWSRTRTVRRASGCGGWFGQFGGKDLEAWNKVALDEALGAEALAAGPAKLRVLRRRGGDPGAASWRTG